MLKRSNLLIPLSNISNEDKDLVGEKAASLGEMEKHGFPLPDGFVITQNAYRQFALKHNLPDKLIKEIFRAYKRLESPLKDATVELFFQKKEVIVAKGEAILVEKIKSIWAHNSTSIVVRKIPQSSLSGIMLTIDPINNDKTKIVVKEDKSGNHYDVLKKDFKICAKFINKGKTQLLTDKQIIDVAALGKKLQKYCYFPQEVYFAIGKNKIFITQTKPVTHISFLQSRISSPRDKVQSFDKLRIDPERSRTGQSSKLQSPVPSGTGQSVINNRKILLKGKPLYPGIATGHLRIIQNIPDISSLMRGEIIVIPYQDMIRSVIKAGAIVVTDNRFHHMPPFTPSARFSGKPAIIVGENQVAMLRNGLVVTVNGTKGEVYKGSLWRT